MWRLCYAGVGLGMVPRMGGCDSPVGLWCSCSRLESGEGRLGWARDHSTYDPTYPTMGRSTVRVGLSCRGRIRAALRRPNSDPVGRLCMYGTHSARESGPGTPTYASPWARGRVKWPCRHPACRPRWTGARPGGWPARSAVGLGDRSGRPFRDSAGHAQGNSPPRTKAPAHHLRVPEAFCH